MPELSLSGLRQCRSFKGSFQFIMTRLVVLAVIGDGDVLNKRRSWKMAALLQQSLMVQDVQDNYAALVNSQRSHGVVFGLSRWLKTSESRVRFGKSYNSAAILATLLYTVINYILLDLKNIGFMMRHSSGGRHVSGLVERRR